VVYDYTPDSSQSLERSEKEKIKINSQKIKGYRQEIEELKEIINRTTPPNV
jgi:hypothetical protein